MHPELFDPLKAKFALREREWLALVAVATICKDGWPASVREVAAYMQRGVSGAHYALTVLEALGFVERNPRFRGGWKITDRGYYVTEA